ncbi:hypothetical protein N9O22_05310 [Gammaproteobacteria bacterium]|nr:hypothetical protein [Gammaproteobacteria bacterium]
MKNILLTLMLLSPLAFAAEIGAEEIPKINWEEAIQKSDYSLNELGYHKCDRRIFGEADRHRQYGVADDDITPENFKKSLINAMCYNYSPHQEYSYYEDLDFDSAVSSFLQIYQSNLPSCLKTRTKDLCFGSGTFHSGIFLGEWKNGYPNGRGVALITSNFPIMNQQSKAVNKEAIYEGEFKNGYPHGFGFYNDSVNTYEGSWFNGERHGFIDWITPPVYAYGLNFKRDSESEFIKITSVQDGTYAAKQITAGDLIVAYQLKDSETVTQTDLIPFNEMVEVLENNNEIKLHLNEFNNSVFVKKSLLKVPFRSFAECTANKNIVHGCYEKASLINKYTEKNTQHRYSRGSFKMGLKHMYDSNDWHSVIYRDNKRNALNFYCHGRSLPMLESNLDTRKNPRPLEGAPGTFVPINFDEQPCPSGTIMLYPELILESKSLLEQAWAEVKDNSTYTKIDFISLLNDAVKLKDNLELFDPAKKISILNPNIGSAKVRSFAQEHHGLCQLSETLSKIACYFDRFEKNLDLTINRLVRNKITANPLSEAYKTKNKIKLDRAKFNVAVIKYCKYLTKRGVWMTSFSNCIFTHVMPSGAFWKCKYFGYSDFDCFRHFGRDSQNFRITYDEIYDYIDLNPNEFKNIDYSKWVFGKELEL